MSTRKLALLTALATCAVLVGGSGHASAQAFQSNRIIDDSIFDNAGTLSSTQIDAFLNSFSNSCISSNNGFAAIDPIGYNPTNGFLYGGNVSAGKVIYDSAQAYEINPQVLLTTLEKEQSLVSGSNGCSVLRYAAATGYGCPDGGTTYNYSGVNLYTKNGTTVSSVSGTCVNSNLKVGFTQQVIRAAWLLKFGEQRSKGNINWAVIKGNWDNSDDPQSCYGGPMTQGTWQRCPSGATTYYDGFTTIDGTSVHMDSGGTAALYWYTPHLAGNDNFVNIFSTWFGSTTGSILFRVNGSTTYYLEWGTYYYPIPSSAILRAYGLSGISPRLIDSLPSGETQGPILTNSVKFGSDSPSDPDYTSTIDLVEGGMKHDAPNWTTLNAYGVTSYTAFPPSLAWVLKPGDPLRDLARKPDGSIFLVEGVKKRLFPDWKTFSTLSGPDYTGTTRVYSKQSVTNMASDYLDTIPDGAPMLLDGTFIKPSGELSIYLFDNGMKFIFTPIAYYAWGRQLDYTLSPASISQIPDAPTYAPILIKSSSGINYVVDSGKKKAVPTGVESAWGLSDSQFLQVTDSALSRIQNSALSILVTPGAGVYYVSGGLRHGIASIADFTKMGFSWQNVDKVDSGTLSLTPQGQTLYAPGSLVRLPNGAVYIIDANYKALGVTSGILFGRFGFSWKNVRNISSSALNGYSFSGLHTLLKDSSTGFYYEIDKGERHLVDSAAFSVSEYDMSTWDFDEVAIGVINSVASGPQMTQFIRGSGTTVYYVENGQKRGITSMTKFYSLGGSWDKVVSVSDDFLQQISSGPVE